MDRNINGVNKIEINIDGINIHYQIDGAGSEILLLHGWGGSVASFAPVHQHLAQHFRACSVDFPGFGSSDQPPAPWGTMEYATLMEKFIHAVFQENPIVIGHSFGGRVGIRLAAEGMVGKMVLVDAAGIRPKRSLRYYSKVYSYKLMKRLLLLPGISRYGEEILENWRRSTGSADYQNASGVMRQSLVRVVNEDLTRLLPKIKIPTLLVWGDKDTATPLADGQKMERLIPGAGLVVFKNAGHFSYLENLDQFLRVLDSFFQEEKTNV